MSDTTDPKSLAMQALVGLLNNMQQAKDFTLEQAPEVLRQMVTYYAVTSWFYFAAGIALIAATIVASHKIANCLKNKEPNDPWPACYIIGAGLCAMWCPLLCYVSTAICATFAPKWFIISKLAELIK